ncbi:hypothetical protein [Endozoicomonas montiporae]|uniref:hypothetical protein n=1 Tax=Endozoicomonas montiporae TaxID=1027273 RepID=UPI000B004CA6|nr:hypothetical protein [Endozoicomonas montiporae]
MDAGARATQEQLPVGQTILGQPPGSRCSFRLVLPRVMVSGVGATNVVCLFFCLDFCIQPVFYGQDYRSHLKKYQAVGLC